MHTPATTATFSARPSWKVEAHLTRQRVSHFRIRLPDQCQWLLQSLGLIPISRSITPSSIRSAVAVHPPLRLRHWNVYALYLRALYKPRSRKHPITRVSTRSSMAHSCLTFPVWLCPRELMLASRSSSVQITVSGATEETGSGPLMMYRLF